MFKDFLEEFIQVGEFEFFVRHGGCVDRPAVLLLHGYPQTSAMWEFVAPILAKDYYVICPDLRGYGRSSKPASDPNHKTYSKREMAKDMLGIMDHFGFNYFLVGAHDRGARVAHRLCIDYENRVNALILLDIAPTREMYAETNADFASAYWHWFFLIQPYPIPEIMIKNDPTQYWLLKCTNQANGIRPFSDLALEEYLKAFEDPAAIHASCEDYRAAATIDIAHDDADGKKKLKTPIKVIWSESGVIVRCFDPLKLWRQRAENIEGESVNATHYMAEEIPKEISELMLDFFVRHAKESTL
jgi:haloacetate dehalogenase